MDRVSNISTSATSIFAMILLTCGTGSVFYASPSNAASSDMSIVLNSVTLSDSTQTGVTNLNLSSSESYMRIIPDFTVFSPSEYGDKLAIEVCIDGGSPFVGSASSEYSEKIANGEMPDNSNISCDDGDTYIRKYVFSSGDEQPQDHWFGGYGSVVATASDGTYGMKVKVSSVDDPSIASEVDATPTISYTREEGVLASIYPLKGTVKPNLESNPVKENNFWDLTVVNNTNQDGPLKMINTMPGFSSSNSISGNKVIESIEVIENTSNADLRIHYSYNYGVSHDPGNYQNDPNNSSTRTIWCDSEDINTAKVVYPSSRAGENCPLPGGYPYINETPTSLMIETDGSLPAGESLKVRVETSYYGEMTSQNKTINLGAEIAGVGISYRYAQQNNAKINLYGMIWKDSDRDGILDKYEEAPNDVHITLEGTDDLGNSISLTAEAQESYGVLHYDFGNLVREGEYELCVSYPEEYYGGVIDKKFEIPVIGPGVRNNMDQSGCESFSLRTGDRHLRAVGMVNYDAIPEGNSAIGGFVWSDENQEGGQYEGQYEGYYEGTESMVKDSGVFMTGWDKEGNRVSRGTTTDKYGDYRFFNIFSGEYILEYTLADRFGVHSPHTEEVPIEYGVVNSDPDNNGLYDFPLETTGIVTDIDAGLVPKIDKPRISGYVWSDPDANGYYYHHESKIAGVQVWIRGLDSNNSHIQKTATTDNNGGYTFEVEEDGKYEVEFGTPSGFDGLTVAFVGDEHSRRHSRTDNVDGRNITLVEFDGNEQIENLYTGFVPSDPAETGTVRGTLWDDLNGNGVRDSGEGPLDGVKVKLYGNNYLGDPIAQGQSDEWTVNTNANGEYVFENVPSGSYTIRITSPDNRDGFAPVGLSSYSPLTYLGEFTRGLDGTTLSQVYLPQGRTRVVDGGAIPIEDIEISGVVWEDINDNGVREDDEKLLSDVNVYLETITQSGEYVSDSAVTASDGSYTFSGVSLGQQDVYIEKPQDGYVKFSKRNILDDDSVDSDVKADGLFKYNSDFNTDITHVDAGIVPEIKMKNITSIVWEDTNGNGIKDDNESIAPGIIAHIEGDDVMRYTVNRTTMTNEQGRYFFGRLAPGHYDVTFEIPDAKKDSYNGFSPMDQGNDEGKDSDVNDQGMLSFEVLNDGEDVKNISAGLVTEVKETPLSVEGRVWRDFNGNGLRDLDEPLVPKVGVDLEGSSIDGTNVALSMETDKDGLYLFEGVKDGTYNVIFDLAEGDNSEFTEQGVGSDDSIDSDVDSSGKVSVTVSASDNTKVVDVGLIPKVGSFVQ